MRILGLKNRSQTCALLIFYALRIGMITAGIIIVMWGGGLFEKSISNDLLLMFLFLWVQGFSAFGFVFMISELFPVSMFPKVAGMWGSLIYFGSTFADFTVQKTGIKESTKVIMSMLFPNIAIARANRNLVQFEYKPGGKGLSLEDTFFEPLDNYRISTFFLIMLYALVSQIFVGVLFEKYGTVSEIYNALRKYVTNKN